MKPFNGKSLLLIGPSTAGKTDIAIAFATRFDGEIVNADKFYLYRGLPRTSGRPAPGEYNGIPTHLYDILNPHDACPTPETYGELARAVEAGISDRGRLAVFDGCSYRFAKALMTLCPTQYAVAAITWSSAIVLEERVRKRVDAVFDDAEAIGEVRRGLQNGWRNTYVMMKGSLIRPLVEYFDGFIGLDEAREKAMAAILYAAHKAQRRFLDLPKLNWFKHDGVDAAATVDAILLQWSAEPPDDGSISGTCVATRAPKGTRTSGIKYYLGNAHSKPERASPSELLRSFSDLGSNTTRLLGVIERMDYSGGFCLTPEQFDSARTCIANQDAQTVLDALVVQNLRLRRVFTRGLNYHLHMPERDCQEEHDHLEHIRRIVVEKTQVLADIAVKLRRAPKQLAADEQAVVATFLDHQKHYAMVMLFGAYNALLVRERAVRQRAQNSTAPCQPNVNGVLDKSLLQEYQGFCDQAIANYYNFMLHDAPPEIAIPSSRIVRSFEALTLPVRTEKGAGTGPKKLVFRDFDHPGHLFLYASNLLRVDATGKPIDCVINPLFGAIEIGFALRAIYRGFGLDKVREVHLIRFSRHDENESLKIGRKEVTHFIPSSLEGDFLAHLRPREKRLLMIDDGVSTGLTLRVLGKYFEQKLQRAVGISAIEQDFSRKRIDFEELWLAEQAGGGEYDSKGKNETAIGYENLEIPAIAERSIDPIPFVIKDALGLR